MNRGKNPSRVARRVSRNMPVEYFILAYVRFEGPVVAYLASLAQFERLWSMKPELGIVMLALCAVT